MDLNFDQRKVKYTTKKLFTDLLKFIRIFFEVIRKFQVLQIDMLFNKFTQKIQVGKFYIKFV